MTLKELNNLPYLGAEIGMYTARLEDLQERISCAAPPISGMPHGSGNKSKVEQVAVEIADLQNKIAARTAERSRLEGYINDISSSFVRSVFYARFHLGLSWAAVADYVGGGQTEDAVKKVCYRQLKQGVERCKSLL